MASFDMLARAFNMDAQRKKDKYRFGKVESVSNGVAKVIIGSGSEVNTTVSCRCLYTPAAGDRVQVCIKASGKCIVIGKV